MGAHRSKAPIQPKARTLLRRTEWMPLLRVRLVLGPVQRTQERAPSTSLAPVNGWIVVGEKRDCLLLRFFQCGTRGKETRPKVNRLLVDVEWLRLP